MTYPARLAGSPPAAPARHASLVDIGLFGLSVLLFFLYAQGWVTLVIGHSDNAAAGAVAPDQGAFVRLMFFPAYAAGLAVMAMCLPQTARALLRQPFLVALLLVTCASLAWSAAPDQTFRRIIAVGFTTLGGVAIAARYSWARLAELMATAFAMLIVASIFVGLFLPGFGRMDAIFPGAWRGLWEEKNALGGNMVFGFVICAAAAIFEPKRRWLWIGMAFGAVFLVLMSTSKTSLLSLLLGMAAMTFVALVRRGPAAGVAFTWLAVVGALLLGAGLLLGADAFFAVLGKDATLTGRTKIWAGVVMMIRERPWLGYGYGAVWDDKTGWGPVYWITKVAGFRAGHSHNSWLQVWLETGLFGLVAWTATWLSTMLRAVVAVYRDPGAYLAFPLLLVFSLMTLTETIALVYNDFRWVMFVAIAAKLALPDSRRPA